jgi:hypothetical protein
MTPDILRPIMPSQLSHFEGLILIMLWFQRRILAINTSLLSTRMCQATGCILVEPCQSPYKSHDIGIINLHLTEQETDTHKITDLINGGAKIQPRRLTPEVRLNTAWFP